MFSFVKDQDDEKPTVVVMKEGDLNEEEVREEEKNIQKAEESNTSEGRISQSGKYLW